MTALDCLRVATREAHARLDEGLPVGQSGCSVEDFVNYLTVMHEFIGVAESGIYSGGDLLSDLGESRKMKLMWIESDLLKSGVVKLNKRFEFSLPMTFAERWGAFYVIEGSMLGGRVLDQLISEKVISFQSRFLSGYGSQTGLLWRETRASLNSQLVAESEIDEACRFAVQAFHELENAFAGIGTLERV